MEDKVNVQLKEKILIVVKNAQLVKIPPYVGYAYTTRAFIPAHSVVLDVR